MPDNKAELLHGMEVAISALERKCENSSPADLPAILKALDKLIFVYVPFREQMRDEAETATQEDLNEMRQIEAEIEAAAGRRLLIGVIGRMAAFSDGWRPLLRAGRRP